MLDRLCKQIQSLQNRIQLSLTSTINEILPPMSWGNQHSVPATNKNYPAFRGEPHDSPMRGALRVLKEFNTPMQSFADLQVLEATCPLIQVSWARFRRSWGPL